MIKIYEGENFESLIQEKILVDFYANWCGPCKMLSPILEKIEEVKILKVNVDEYPSLARDYAVMSIPCLILFEEGKEKKRKIGFIPENQLKEWIK